MALKCLQYDRSVQPSGSYATLLMHREHGSSDSSTIVNTVFKFALFSVQKIAPTQINVKHRLLRGRIHCTMLKDSVEKVCVGVGV